MSSKDLEKGTEESQSLDEKSGNPGLDTTPPTSKGPSRSSSPSSSSTHSTTPSRARPSRSASLARASGISRTVSEVRDGIPNQRELDDVEGGQHGEKAHDEKDTGEEAEVDENLVTWEGPDDPANPKNWPIKTKWAAVITGMLPSLTLTRHNPLYHFHNSIRSNKAIRPDATSIFQRLTPSQSPSSPSSPPSPQQWRPPPSPPSAIPSTSPPPSNSPSRSPSLSRPTQLVPYFGDQCLSSKAE